MDYNETAVKIYSQIKAEYPLSPGANKQPGYYILNLSSRLRIGVLNYENIKWIACYSLFLIFYPMEVQNY